MSPGFTKWWCNVEPKMCRRAYEKLNASVYCGLAFVKLCLKGFGEWWPGTGKVMIRVWA